MTDEPDLDDVMRMLRTEYLGAIPSRLAEFDRLFAAWQGGESSAAEGLQRLLHQLTGSAGSYGFAEASAVARALEQRLKPQPPLDAALAAEIGEGRARLAALLLDAAS